MRLGIYLHIVIALLSVKQGLSQSYFLNGNAAAIGGDCYRLTNSGTYQIGTVWYANTLNLGQPFDLIFTMNFGSNDNNGADGMVFVLQTVGTSAIGVTGAGMGFQGFNPSFGIEFDTHPNNAQTDPANNLSDPTFDHIAFLRNGNVNHALSDNLAGPIAASASNINIEDGLDHWVRITWDPTTDMVRCYFDCQLRIEHTVDLENTIFTPGANVYWGFTASTGGLFNVQTVCLSPNIAGLPDNVPACTNGSVTLNAPSVPSATYQWSPVTGLSSSSAQSVVASPTQSTMYYLTITSNCGPAFFDSTFVEIEPPIIVNAGTDTSLCAGSTVQLNGQADSGLNHLWTSIGGSIVSGASTLQPVVNDGGSYVLTATNSLGCFNRDTVAVTLIPLPVVQISDTSICPEGSVVIDAGSGWQSIQWSAGGNNRYRTFDAAGNYSLTVELNNCFGSDNFLISPVTFSNLSLGSNRTICQGDSVSLNAGEMALWNTGVTASTIVASQTGLYAYTIQSSNCSVSDSVEILVNPLPSVNLGIDRTICEGDSVIISNSVAGLWNTGTISNTIEVYDPGVYTIRCESNGCVATDSVRVNTILLPAVDLGSDLQICRGEEIVLNASGPGNSAIIWSDGDTSTTLLVNQSGIYAVLVRNTCGNAQDSIRILVEECEYSLYIPNAFSPNGDAINDVWAPEGENIRQMELFIFNRWGEQVFYSDKLFPVWTGGVADGQYYVEDGIYTYLIKFLPKNGIDPVVKRGTIVIFR
jgi:gliding motility-associated-like protein